MESTREVYISLMDIITAVTFVRSKVNLAGMCDGREMRDVLRILTMILYLGCLA